eukprot:1176948-Prorocentrum_minimum.AAC.2
MVWMLGAMVWMLVRGYDVDVRGHVVDVRGYVFPKQGRQHCGVPQQVRREPISSSVRLPLSMCGATRGHVRCQMQYSHGLLGSARLLLVAVVVLGLDSAGKTTILYKLHHEGASQQVPPTVPTIARTPNPPFHQVEAEGGRQSASHSTTPLTLTQGCYPAVVIANPHIAAAVSSKRPSSASFGARDYRAGGGQFTADGGQFTADEGQFTVGVRVCAGFNVESVQYKSVVLTMWDVGGQTRLRPLWRHYLKDTDALIYVVDAHDRDRVAEAADEFHVRIFP